MVPHIGSKIKKRDSMPKKKKEKSKDCSPRQQIQLKFN